MDKIDIRDLRVNDWICHKDCPIPLQVSGLKDNEVYLKHSFEYNRTVGFIRQDRHSMCSIERKNGLMTMGTQVKIGTHLNLTRE